MPSLTRRLPAPCGREAAVEGFLTFAAGAATFPWRSHALWFFSQMVRWRQSRLTPERLALAQSTYRPDLFRRAVAGIGLPVPSANSKVEGALVSAIAAGSPDGRLVLGPDTFFDGRQFDPADLDSYVSAQQAADVSV